MPAAEYHAPGTEILGQEAPLAERTITVDRLLISHLFVDNLDEKLAHFEARGELARNMSIRLSQTYDNHVARNILKAAGTATPIASDTTMGGLVITDADLISATVATKLDAWVENLFACRVNFDNKWVNDGEIYCGIKPATYYFLIRNAMTSGYSLIDSRIGGEGSISKGSMGDLAGIKLISFPGLPDANYTAEAFHKVDCRNTVGLVWTKGAAGTVKVFDIGVETEYQISRQGTLVVAKYAMGHDVLQAECAIQLRSSAPV